MSPVPVATVAQMATSLLHTEPYLIALISSVNGIRNPEFQHAGDSPDEGFVEVVTIMSELIAMHRLHWVRNSATSGDLSILLDRSDPVVEAKIDEMLRLLGLPEPSDDAATVMVPVSMALNARDAGAIGFTTRSVFQMIEVLSAAVEVPQAHIDEGVAIDYPPPGLVGRNLKIHRSESRPKQASVVVRYRDHWYYIDDRDLATKRFFKVVGAIWTSTMAEASAGSKAPLLTVPVSR